MLYHEPTINEWIKILTLRRWTQSDIALKVGLSQNAVSSRVRHLGLIPKVRKPKVFIPADQAEVIRKLTVSGTTQDALAMMYNVTQTCVGKYMQRHGIRSGRKGTRR